MSAISRFVSQFLGALVPMAVFACSVAYGETGGGLSFEDISRLFGGRTEDCPPSLVSRFSEVRSASLVQIYEQLKRNEDHCEASEIAEAIMVASATPADKIKWAVRTTSELRSAGDYRDAMLMALRAHAAHEGEAPQDLEGLRFEIVLTLHSAVQKLGSRHDPQWLEFGLGIKAHPSSQADLLRYESFLRDYPKSKHSDQIRKMQAEAVNFFVDRELEISATLMTRSEYFAAIARLERLYAFEFVQNSARLKDVLVQVIRAQRAFAEALGDRPWLKIHDKWTDQRLRYVFRLPMEQPVDRQALSDLLIRKANDACGFLKTNFPTVSCP